MCPNRYSLFQIFASSERSFEFRQIARHGQIARPKCNFEFCKMNNGSNHAREVSNAQEKQHRLIGTFTSILDIDVVRIKDHPTYVAGYALKHAKRNPAIMDEVLILPKSPEDVSPRQPIFKSE
jgi:hypothetical protein